MNLMNMKLMNLKGRLHQSRLIFSSALSNRHEQKKYIQYNNKIHNKHNTTTRKHMGMVISWYHRHTITLVSETI